MDPARITLRPFKLSDTDDFFSWAKDGRVTQYLKWDPIPSRQEALRYLQEVAIPHPWRRSICLDDRSIGYVLIRTQSGSDCHLGRIGYAVSSEYWNRGIATVALKMAMSSAFEEIQDLVRVEALVEEENKGSQRALEKVGFQKEGFLRKYTLNKGKIRDVLIYSFLSSDKIM